MPKDNSPKSKPLPSAEYLRACFDYAPETGELRWRWRPREHFIRTQVWGMWNSRWAKKSAGFQNNHGYYRVFLDHTPYSVHRIIWKWMTGEEPPPMLDHKDGNSLNNRWENLRPATYVEQNRNRLMKVSNTGHRGAYPASRRRWRARIGVEGTSYHLGSFTTPEEAAEAYEAAARRIHGEFYRALSKSK